MSRTPRAAPFPYAERARASEEARAAVHSTFRVMWDARADRNDTKDPRTAAWQAALARDRLAWVRAFPSGDVGFRQALAAARQGESAGLADILAFLEADPRFFRSGYFKERILRAIKSLPFTPDEAERLRRIVLDIVDRRDGREFRDYCRLARLIATPDFRSEVEGRAASPDPAVARRARWVLAALGGPG